MKKIIFVCKQKEIKDDLDVAAAMNLIDYDYELHTLNNLAELKNAISAFHPDIVVIYSDIIEMRDKWDLGVKTVYCAKNRADLEKYASYGLETIGIAKSSDELLSKLAEEPYPVKTQDKPEENIEKKQESKPKNTGKTPSKKPAPIDIDLDEDEENDDGYEIEVDEDEEPEDSDGETLIEKTEKKKKAAEEELPVLEEDYDELDFYDEKPEEDIEEIDMEETESPEELEEIEEIEEPTEVEEKEKNKPEKIQKKRNSGENTARKRAEKKDAIQEQFEKDVSGNKGKTKVIAVYSAKGGVGKTTIASELALYLSMVENGPRKLRVCIIDYNIDFGDVKATLGMEQTTKSITYWADEVKEFLDKGYDPESIVYTKEEIEEYLDRNKRSGLWVLPAPFTNEDSMGIDSEELRVIIRNLIENGEFDYIICDTGNNTRDSTMIALENADVIMMIMTQNINTANCDAAFLKTMKTIDFDLSNTKLIINNILPVKMAAISVDEILDYFKSYECIGKINYNPDVIKATNVGEPLAFDPSHEFTKQMKEIVAFVLNDETLKAEAAVPEKKSLFSFLKRKKKKQ